MEIKIIYLFFIMSFLVGLSAQADLNLTVAPYEGGGGLRFGRVNETSQVSKEVKIRISSTDEERYQIKQRLLEPIVNENGITLDEGVISFYTVRGSNALGSLYQDDLRSLSSREDILYSSNQSGSSDSFDIVYSLDGSKLAELGQFQGRILISLEPAGSSSPQTVILTLDFNAELEFEINLESSKGASKLRLDTKSEDTMKEYLEFNLTGNLDEELELYQEVVSIPCSEAGATLNSKVLKFFISGSTSEGIYYRTPQYLEYKDMLIYSSLGGEDSFQINFSIDPEANLNDIEPGLYRGRLAYHLEGENIDQVIPIDLEVEVRTIFDIEIIMEENLAFKNLKPNSLPQEKTVIIEVNSNIKQPYQVTQTAYLANKEGEGIPESCFTMRQEHLLEEEKGELKFEGFSPVPIEEKDMLIFTSDAQGSPISFKIIYRIMPGYKLPAGDYSGQISYSLSAK